MPVDYKQFIHPEDRDALEKLKAIPLLDNVTKAFLKNITEDLLHGINMVSKVKITKKQLPILHALLVDVCSELQIEEPEFYLEMNPLPNAYTYGDTKPFVVINSGIIDLLSHEEIKSVIAHECGHILCHHVLYRTLASFLVSTGGIIGGMFGAGIISEPLKWALQYWVRRSEFSADRVAAYVMQDASVVARTMMHLAGGASKIVGDINLDLFMEQAEEYKKYIKDFGTSKILQNWEVRNMTHPYPALRAAEVQNWFSSYHPTAKQSFEDKTLKW